MPETHYPVGMVSVCCGFFLVYLIEELAHSCVESMQKEDDVMVVDMEVEEQVGRIIVVVVVGVGGGEGCVKGLSF